VTSHGLSENTKLLLVQSMVLLMMQCCSWHEACRHGLHMPFAVVQWDPFSGRGELQHVLLLACTNDDVT